jgi:hypothetical protein
MRVIALALLVIFAGSGDGHAEPRACRAIVVDRSLQAAVDRARPCDWILLPPGVYRGSVAIRTADVHLRGLDRNRVIVDGAHGVGNGITVEANGVSIENLTVRNFDRRSPNDDATGTQVRWRGVHGWSGRYLTAYDTGLLGGYGLWASNSRGGVLEHIYASGFDDSGLYVGACRDCVTVVRHALSERNLIGLAATNASGHFVVRSSTFRENAVGVSFNSSVSDPPPPQLGACEAGTNRTAAPAITTTLISRCTVFTDNRVLDNNALDVPSNTASVRPGAGIGIDLLGAYADAITANVIAGNHNVGVLGLPLPPAGPTRFAFAGNRIAGNRIAGSRVALALAGGSSVDNCVRLNHGAPTEPADLEPWSCAHATTPGMPAASTRRILELERRLHAKLAAHRHSGQPAPPPQPTMPRPCRGVPPNPLCP